jgi:two-component system, response regulator
MSSGIDVLIVDHSALEAEMTLLAIRRAAPYARTQWLNSGDMALQYFFAIGEFKSQTPRLPRLVLLELDMPVFNGLSVLDVIRSHPFTEHLPVAILSRRCNPDAFRRGDLFDADSYIQKSLDPEEYCVQIEQLLSRWIPKAPVLDLQQVLRRAGVPVHGGAVR